jgi:uncharacterized protein YfiM (DUF2279 family)
VATTRFRGGGALALLCAALCATTGCAASVCKDPWLGPDAAKHFAAGLAIGAATTALARDDGADPAYDPTAGVVVVAVAGAAKETYDLKVRRTCWSWKDLAWSLLGGVVGGSVAAAVGEAGR